MLIASLPHLPRFDKVDRLPISREKLLKRLKMLDAEDWRVANEAAEFLRWRHHPVERDEVEMIERYQNLIKHLYHSPTLKAIFEFPINQRTIMAAIRKKEMEKTRPNKPWGVGNLVTQIERNWEDASFKIGSLYPWIQEAREYLKIKEPLKLDYLLKTLLWNKLDLTLFKNSFGFEVIIAYLLKWDIIQEWLSYNQEKAKKRMETLVLEAIHEK